MLPLPNTPAGAAVTMFANGLAFTDDGDLIVADTDAGRVVESEARPPRQRAEHHGLRQHVHREYAVPGERPGGAPAAGWRDGIALDRAGNIWVDANERNAVVVVDKHGKEVRELFRNAPVADELRNAGPLEFPTSPFLSRPQVLHHEPPTSTAATTPPTPQAN